MRFLTVTWAVAWRDLRVELRGRELLPSIAQFIVLALVIANFAFDLDAVSVKRVSSGVLWLVLVFAGLVAFSRTFAGEREGGALDAMLLTPATHAAILTGKALAQAAVLLACELVLLPAMTVFLGAPLGAAEFGVVALAVVGMAILGCLFSALASQTRARELLLPVLALPLWIPYVVLGGGLLEQVQQQLPIPVQPLIALVYMDILFLMLTAVAARFVLDD
jgi:heme exporter protein B